MRELVANGTRSGAGEIAGEIKELDPMRSTALGHKDRHVCAIGMGCPAQSPDPRPVQRSTLLECYGCVADERARDERARDERARDERRELRRELGGGLQRTQQTQQRRRCRAATSSSARSARSSRRAPRPRTPWSMNFRRTPTARRRTHALELRRDVAARAPPGRRARTRRPPGDRRGAVPSTCGFAPRAVGTELSQPREVVVLDAGGDGDLELLSVRDVSKLGWDEKEGQWRTFEESVTSDEADGAYTTCATDFVGDADLDVIGDILTRDGAPTSCATTCRWLCRYRSSSSPATRSRAAAATERTRSSALAGRGRAHRRASARRAARVAAAVATERAAADAPSRPVRAGSHRSCARGSCVREARAHVCPVRRTTLQNSVPGGAPDELDGGTRENGGAVGAGRGPRSYQVARSHAVAAVAALRCLYGPVVGQEIRLGRPLANWAARQKRASENFDSRGSSPGRLRAPYV